MEASNRFEMEGLLGGSEIGETLNNVNNNYIESRIDDTDNNNNLILITPKFLPIPKLKLNYNNNPHVSKAVTKIHPAKVKGSGAKGARKNQLKRHRPHCPIRLCCQNQCWQMPTLEQRGHISG